MRTASPSWARRNAAPDSPWTFGVIGEHEYGSSSGGWELSEGDLLSPLAGDFDGDGQYDFPITSAWGLSILTISGSDFEEIGLAPYEDLPISSSLQLVGVGRFDHSGGGHRLLFAPSLTASLTAEPTAEAVRSGQQELVIADPIFFASANYGGTAVSLPVGNYNQAALIAEGIADNSLSSLLVQPGFKI